MSERHNLERTRRSIGSHPNFHDTDTVDALTAMVIALLGEVAVLRDRIDASERLAAQAGGAGPDEVDRYTATPEVRASRQAVRDAIYDRVLGVGVEKLLPEALRREQTSYDRIMQEVATR